MTDYKLPACWLGKSRTITNADGTVQAQVITEADIDPVCNCWEENQAFWCMEGHLTECHAGMSCEEALCSHYERERLFEEQIDLDQGNLDQGDSNEWHEDDLL